MIRCEFDGAAEALAPVLALPSAQRDHTIVTSVERVRTTLSAVPDPSRDIINLTGAIEAFTAEPLALPEMTTTVHRVTLVDECVRLPAFTVSR